MTDIVSHLLAIAGLLCASAFFSGSETALFSLTLADRRRMEAVPSRVHRAILAMLHDRHGVLAALLFGNMVVNTAIYSIGFRFSIGLAEHGYRIGAWAVAAGTLLAVVIMGEVTPKGIAVEYPVQAARIIAPFLYVFYRATRPVSSLLKVIGVRSSEYFARRAPRQPYVTREELTMLLRSVEQRSEIDPFVREMLAEVVELSTIRVNEVMRPRVDVAMFNLARGRDQFTALMKGRRQEEVPVYEGTADNVVGFVFTREVLLNPEADLRSLVRPVLFVPDLLPTESLLRQFRETHHLVAIVVDEFGGTAGMTTRDDILAEMVGETREERGRAPSDVERVGSDVWLLTGDLTERELREELRLPNLGEAQTLGGFAMLQLGHVPEPGEEFVAHGLRFTVEEMTGRRVRRLRAEKLPPEAME